MCSFISYLQGFACFMKSLSKQAKRLVIIPFNYTNIGLFKLIYKLNRDQVKIIHCSSLLEGDQCVHIAPHRRTIEISKHFATDRISPVRMK